MKNKFYPIRFKLILTFLTSAVLSFLCIFALFLVFAVICATNVKLLNWINSNYMTIMPLIFLAAFVLFVIVMFIFFYFLMQRSVDYLNEIMCSLQEVSKGKLDISIPKRSSDELGELSQIINDMVLKIKMLVEEERGWEQSKLDLINNVSHDLRTPMTSMLGYLELIAEHKYADEAALHHYADIARNKCFELKGLIDQLFEYSKLSSRDLKIYMADINLGELLEQVIVGFMPAVMEAGMEFRMFFDKSKIIVPGDPALLARLFENLISNSIKYGREGKYIDIELTERSEGAVVKVVNYGVTIQENDLSHIFEKFYRAEKSRSREKGGSGLGLAIVRSIAEIHGAVINAVSRNNRTEFEVRLKCSERRG